MEETAVIQDDLYGQTIDVTVPVAVMGDELSKKDAKDIAMGGAFFARG